MMMRTRFRTAIKDPDLMSSSPATGSRGRWPSKWILKFEIRPMNPWLGLSSFLLLAVAMIAPAQENRILEIVTERPLLPGEFTEDQISQALCWRFGIPPPIIKLGEDEKTKYREAFEALGSATFDERDAAQKRLITLMPQPRIVLDWAKASEDPEIRMRAIDVIRGWKGNVTKVPNGVSTKKLDAVDVLSRLPAGPFMIRAMNAMQENDSQASNEFYRKQIRAYAYGLNREQRLECLRLTSTKLKGSKYAPASRNLLSMPMLAEEMRDADWLLEIAKIHSRPDALSDYRSLQFLEQAFRGAPADLDVAPFEPLLVAENPNRFILGGVLGRLGHKEGAALYLTGLKENQNLQRYAYTFLAGMNPASMPDVKEAEAAYAKMFQDQAADLKKRYSSSPEYMASQFSRILGPLIEIPGVQDHLRTLAKDKTSPIRLQAAMALRSVTGKKDRQLLADIKIADGPISTYFYSTSSRYSGSYFQAGDVVKAIIMEIIDAPDQAAKKVAEADLKQLFHLQAEVISKDLKACREKGRPSASTVKRNIESLCASYQAFVLPLGIDAELQDYLLDFATFNKTKRDAYSIIPMMTALNEAVVADRREQLIDQVITQTNVVDALYLLAHADPTPARAKKLYQLKQKEFEAFKPMPDPVRAALQVIDPPAMYASNVEFIGTVPGLSSVNLKRFDLKTLPEAWLKKLDPNTAQLVRYCQDRSAELPDKAISIDKEHLEAVLSLARAGDAPPALVALVQESIPDWVVGFNKTNYKRPSASDLHRMALITATTNTDMTPTNEHPSAIAYGWIIEARRRMLQGDPAGAVKAWEALHPLMAATRAYSSSSTRDWIEEEWIARWLAGEDRKKLRASFEAHALTGSYPGYEIIEFLLGDGEAELAHELAEIVLAIPGGRATAWSASSLAWTAAEMGDMERAAFYANAALRTASDIETLRHALLLQGWIKEQPAGFAAYSKLSDKPDRTASDFQALLSTINDPELKALAAWRGAGEAWKAENETARRKLLDAAAALPETLYGGFAKLERDAPPADKSSSMITTDTLSDQPFPRQVRPDFSRIGFTKNPNAEPRVFQRILFLDERGLPILDGGVATVNTAWGLWLSHMDLPYRYRPGLRRVVAKGLDGTSEAHAVEVLSWRSLMEK